jgi:regulatory protein
MAGPPKRPRAPLSAAGARDSALRALSRREHSAAELKHKLGRRGLDAQTAETVVESLAERGWQSDTRYAEMLLRSRIHQGCGPLRIEHELAAAGIAEAEIRSTLAAAAVNWSEACAALHARRFSAPPQSAADWQKQYRYLAGRGFTPEQVRDALKGDPETF